jgi:hypothetical protein
MGSAARASRGVAGSLIVCDQTLAESAIVAEPLWRGTLGPFTRGRIEI